MYCFRLVLNTQKQRVIDSHRAHCLRFVYLEMKPQVPGGAEGQERARPEVNQEPKHWRSVVMQPTSYHVRLGRENQQKQTNGNRRCGFDAICMQCV